MSEQLRCQYCGDPLEEDGAVCIGCAEAGEEERYHEGYNQGYEKGYEEGKEEGKREIYSTIMHDYSIPLDYSQRMRLLERI